MPISGKCEVPQKSLLEFLFEGKSFGCQWSGILVSRKDREFQHQVITCPPNLHFQNTIQAVIWPSIPCTEILCFAFSKEKGFRFCQDGRKDSLGIQICKDTWIHQELGLLDQRPHTFWNSISYWQIVLY
jgi:hypothetical protein